MTSHGTRRGDSLFESISLSSTMGGGTRPGTSDIVSTSEDEELDPTDFLSSQSPELLRQEDRDHINGLGPVEEEPPEMGQLGPSLSNSGPGPAQSVPDPDLLYQSKDHKASSPESILTDTMHQSLTPELGDMGDTLGVESVLNNLNFSEIAYPHEKTDTESPLQHLQQTYNMLFQELQNNVKLHKQALESGNDNLARIRVRLVDNFHNLSENQYSLHELYERESNYNLAMCERFKKWDQKRSRILDKIKAIKSPKNSYGTKLMSLLDDNAVIDQEIDQLEARLVMLKAKKKLLYTEIDDTSSVLESKTSKYVKAFKELDQNGHAAILETLRQNGLSSEGAMSLVRTTPVDVTFYQHFQGTRGSGTSTPKTSVPTVSAPKAPVSTPKAPVTTPTAPDVGKVSNGNMGMQAYEVPQTYTEPTPTPNNGNESDAYHKGFSTGYQQSGKFKQQLQQIFNSYIKPLLEQKEAERKVSSPNIDDDGNTITEKVDLMPIIDFLQHKVVAYSELSKNSGVMSTVYYKSSGAWRDICYSIESKEKELEYTILDRNKDSDTAIGNILTGILDNLVQFFQDSTKIQPSQNNILSILIHQEADGLIKALSMIPAPFSERKHQYINQFSLKSPESKPTKEQSYSQVVESESQSSYLYNVNSNAIEHKIIPHKPEEKSKQASTLASTSTSKQVKGE